ncbi:NmrA family NAD(P)-binding protein [Streptomyces sp. FXJ1.172]|uniref:NmrA family NAD(P)-binding protein n=1 Tax=Streptomyces sp. FXJ1.172 TaxID=710705 RepID=UPI0007CFAEDA|nr:NmrA family NAD(P)-binding protein [Streptomyces sp. FXJ1.172]WEO96322.1 NmrA family NAD(P)-binding protein [Streptomyces sp. FXJ1.172]
MIVVTGATGTVGAQVVGGLRARGEKVRALVRTGSVVPDAWDADVELVAADFTDPASLDLALAGADAVYLLVAVHPEMAAHEGNVIDAAVRTGRRPHVVLHAAAGVAEHGEDVRFLAAHTAGFGQLGASGLPWTVLAPNGFFQNFLGMAAALRAGRLSLPGGTGAVSYVDTRDVAEAAVAVLTGGGHENAVYTLTGPAALTHAQIAEALGEVAGHPVTYQALDPEAALAGMLAAGWEPWRAEGMVELYGLYAAGGAAAVTSDVEKLTGHPARPFAAFAAEHAAVLRGETER